MSLTGSLEDRISETNQREYPVNTFGLFFIWVKDEGLEPELNQLGEDGWEVTGFRVIENTKQSQVIAKRPITRDVRCQRSMP